MDKASERPVVAAPDGRMFAEALARFGAGVSAQLNGAYPVALSNFLAVIALDPLGDEAYMRAAALHLQLSQPDQAVGLMQQLCQLKPNAARAYIWLGAVSYAAAQKRESYAAYRKAIQLDPGSAEGYYELAMNYVRDDETEKAILVLERGAERSDQPALLLGLLGEMYLHKTRQSKTPEAGSEYRRMARVSFERAARMAPDSIPILEQLSALYILEEDMERSAATLQRLDELRPDDLQVKKQLALVYGALEKPHEASRVLEEIARKSVVNPRAYFFIGELYEKLGDRVKAILNFRLATQMEPPDAAPYLHLALLTLEDSPQEAIEYLRDGLLKIPDDVRLSETLAYVYMSRKEYDEAMRYFESTLRLVENDPDATGPTLSFLFNYALAAHHARRHEEASQLLRKAVRLDPATLHAYLQYVFQQDETPQIVTAQKVFATLVEELPEQRKAILTSLALLFSYQKEFEKAVQLFAQVEEEARAADQLAQLTEQFYYWYGSAQERLGRLDEAEILLKKTIELNPEHAAAYNYLAYMWAEKAIHLKQAEAYILQALKHEPDNPAFLDTHGWVLYMKNDYVNAERQIRKASELLPDDPVINEHFGDVLHKLGRTAEARVYWQKALDLDPSNEALVLRLREAGIMLDATARTHDEPPAESPQP